MKIKEIFGKNIFTIDKSIAKKIVNNEINDKRLEILIDEIKDWAIDNGATHYTHWFHPLRGTTAEKHDSFISFDNNKVIEKFNYKDILRQEPDASSFPSGGIRNTFESRGYTIWDPTSPLFILKNTLCIPTVFVSYNGESLDYKTPLLKTTDLLNNIATKVINKYFDNNVKSVSGTLGCEQEFFVIDRKYYESRPDLKLLGKTVFGHSSAKDQQLSDHYFGSIPNRVLEFLEKVEEESYKLGIPIKTRHNEVAPSQFECAPIFEDINVSIDHNQLFMYLLDDISNQFGLKVLLNEKPFADINGSGKHVNWSLRTDKNDNLLSPGKTYDDKLRFLTFFLNIIKAVNDYPDLLRASVATPENEPRLGGHEAPPAIMSVFIGKKLTNVLNELESNGKVDPDPNPYVKKRTEIYIGQSAVDCIPDIFIDNTDRNRTSPFAFTGDKFEFRSPGSSVNCSKPITVLQLIVSNQLESFMNEVDELIEKENKLGVHKLNKKEIIIKVLQKYVPLTSKIRFDGNNYSQEWIEESKKRGLNNINSTIDAIKSYLSPDIIKMYQKYNILTEKELLSRYEIKLEKYIKKIQIEGRIIGDLVINHIIPSVIKYQNILYKNNSYKKLTTKKITNGSGYVESTIKEIDERLDNIFHLVNNMVEERKIANRKASLEDRTRYYNDKVYPYFEKIRYESDRLELIVDNKLWPLPKYRDILFSHL